MVDNLQKCGEVNPPPLCGHILDVLLWQLCNAQVAYCRNMTILSAHLARHHPEVKADVIAKQSAAASQQTLKAALYKTI